MTKESKLPSLTSKELLILALWGCSLTVKESARLLDLSDRSINYYRGRLKCMLNVRTSHALIRTLIMMDEYESLIKLGKRFLMGEIDENDGPSPLREPEAILKGKNQRDKNDDIMNAL